MKSKVKKYHALGKILTGVLLLLISGLALADDTKTLGSIASNITGSFRSIGKLMFAVSFIAGFGFLISGIFKFKQHKDNPTQIPMGTPLAMVVIGAMLVFLPSILKPAGKTMFGESATYGGFKGAGITSEFPADDS